MSHIWPRSVYSSPSSLSPGLGPPFAAAPPAPSFFGGARIGTGSGFGGTFLAAMVAQDDIVWGGTSGSKYAVCGVLKSHRESVQRGNAARNA